MAISIREQIKNAKRVQDHIGFNDLNRDESYLVDEFDPI